jgi:hypothetical protein
MLSKDKMTQIVDKIDSLPKGQNFIYYTGSGMDPVPSPLAKLVKFYVSEGIVSQHVRRKDKDNLHFIVQKRV